MVKVNGINYVSKVDSRLFNIPNISTENFSQPCQQCILKKKIKFLDVSRDFMKALNLSICTTTLPKEGGVHINLNAGLLISKAFACEQKLP